MSVCDTRLLFRRPDKSYLVFNEDRKRRDPHCRAVRTRRQPAFAERLSIQKILHSLARCMPVPGKRAPLKSLGERTGKPLHPLTGRIGLRNEQGHLRIVGDLAAFIVLAGDPVDQLERGQFPERKNSGRAGVHQGHQLRDAF